MTQDEIMEMAKEAHRKLVTEVYVGHMGQLNPWEIELLKIFANLVAAKAFQNGYEKGVAGFNEAVSLEREACAKVCEKYAAANTSWTKAAVKDCAAIIKARGKQA